MYNTWCLPASLQNALTMGVAPDFVNNYPIVTIQTLVSLKNMLQTAVNSKIISILIIYMYA